eukprot:3302964-Prymnesium_polylepis.1
MLPPPPPLSCTLRRARRDARARARPPAPPIAHVSVASNTASQAARAPLACRRALKSSPTDAFLRLLDLDAAPAARDDAVAERRASRAESRQRRTPLLVAAARLRQPFSSSSSLCLYGARQDAAAAIARLCEAVRV